MKHIAKFYTPKIFLSGLKTTTSACGRRVKIENIIDDAICPNCRNTIIKEKECYEKMLKTDFFDGKGKKALHESINYLEGLLG